MAKIDVSKIENFKELDADALRKLITDYEYEDNAEALLKIKIENQKLLKAKDDATSEASNYKKQLREKQSDDERAEAERKEELEKLKAENAEYKKNAQINAYKATAIGMGYSEELASKRAEALANNDFNALNEVDKEFLVAHDKELNAKSTRNTATPPTGAKTADDNNGVTKEQFNSMGYRERVDLFEKNPELYAELNK